MPASDKFRSTTLSQYIFGIQAAPLLSSGIYALLWPSAAANFLPNSPLQGVSTGTVQAMSLTSISLGTMYAISAYQNYIPIMIATIPGRVLAAWVFWRSGNGEGGWRSAAPFELLMGILTAVGVGWSW